MKSKYGNDYSVNPEYEKRKQEQKEAYARERDRIHEKRMERIRLRKISRDKALGRDRNETVRKIRIFTGNNISWIITIGIVFFINTFITYGNYSFTREGWFLAIILLFISIFYRSFYSIKNGEMKVLKLFILICFIVTGVVFLRDSSGRSISYKSAREYDNKKYIVKDTFYNVRVYELKNPFLYIKKEVDKDLKNAILNIKQ